MIRTKYAIIGSGPAAFYATRTIRKRDPEGKLVIIGAEGYLPYFRPLISYYLAGLVPLERLFMKEADYYRQKKIEFISGTVIEVKGQEKILAYQPLASEEQGKIADHTPNAHTTQYLQFEKLLIASGGVPTKPDIPGINTPGVYFFRTIDDAKKIAAGAKGCKKALLLGGGLVNLKAAYALHKLGLETTLVITSSGILSQMLDKKGAAIIAAYLTEKGLKMIFQNDVAEIHGNGSGVTGVTLANGQELEANLIVIGKGVRPFTPFLRGSGVTEKYGVVVDEQLQTNLPGIYAAGDATLCRDMLLDEPANNALWPNATAQGEIAGANMSGDRLTYRGSMKMNATEFFGLPVIAAGLGRVQSSADHPWEIYQVQHSLRSRQEPCYLRLVFQKDYLAGYVAIGENRKAGMLTNLIMGQYPLTPQQKERLINGDLTFPFSV
ncbi:MAG: NAD(P)/FAD-dependent oxidoreductase [Dethiobacteria bacterium]|jgi:nitrite reductase (NADH) large subunit